MISFEEDLMIWIAQRRQELLIQARDVTGAWFTNDTRFKHKRRFYVPLLRIKDEGTDRESISLSWGRRFPVNAWVGTAISVSGSQQQKVLKVMTKYVAANRRGPAYPRIKFLEAPADELDDILAAEAMLAPIRAELAFLGALRRTIGVFYRKFELVENNPTEVEDTANPIVHDEALPE